MDFWLFVFYYIICTIFLLIVGLVSYKLVFRRRLDKISNTFEKQLENYFNNYDIGGSDNE